MLPVLNYCRSLFLLFLQMSPPPEHPAGVESHSIIAVFVNCNDSTGAAAGSSLIKMTSWAAATTESLYIPSKPKYHGQRYSA